MYIFGIPRLAAAANAVATAAQTAGNARGQESHECAVHVGDDAAQQQQQQQVPPNTCECVTLAMLCVIFQSMEQMKYGD